MYVGLRVVGLADMNVYRGIDFVVSYSLRLLRSLTVFLLLIVKCLHSFLIQTSFSFDYNILYDGIPHMESVTAITSRLLRTPPLRN